MDRTELIEGLAVVACAYIEEKDMTAIAVGHFATACSEGFKLSHAEQSMLVQRMVDKCIRKFMKHQQ